MDPGLSSFIQLNVFSTGRRLHAFRQVLLVAKEIGFPALEALLDTAIVAETETWALELRWGVLRRRGKLSAKQLKAQRALQQLDAQVDHALIGLRDGAASLLQGAGPDEQELVDKVEAFLDALFPGGAQAVTSLPYAVELTAVQGIVEKLQGELAPAVTELGLGVQAKRLANLCKAYGDAQKSVDTLDFGTVRAARAKGQHLLLEVVAVVLGACHEATGDHAQKRAALLAPIVKQNKAISDHIRARRAVPDVNPDTGEEEAVEPPGTPETEAPGDT